MTARRRRVRPLGVLVAAALVLPGAAHASVQAGATPLQTAAPDVVSAAVAAAPNQATLCFDQEVRAPSPGFFGVSPLAGTDVVPITLADKSVGFTETGGNGTFLRGIHLRSYGLTGSLVPQQPIISNPIAARVEGSCLRLYFLPIWGAGLADNSLVEVEPGAVQGAAGQANTPGAAALDGSTLVALKGETTGPKLVRVTPDNGARTVTYSYAAPVVAMPACGAGAAACPRGVDPAAFGYYTASGNPTGGRLAGAIVSSGTNSITVRFPAAPAGQGPGSGTRFFSMPGAVVRNNPNAAYPNSLDVVGPKGGNGAATDHPDLQSAVPVPGMPGAYDLHYDAAVVPANPAPGIVPGCLAVPENPSAKGVPLNIPGVGMMGHSLGRPGSDPRTIRISFTAIPGSDVTPGVEALQDAKIVRVVDLGDGAAVGCATGLRSGLTSSRGEADVRTPPMQKGFTEAPDLVSVVVDRAAGSMTFSFDQVIAPGTIVKNHDLAAPGDGATTVGGLVQTTGDLLSDAKPSTSFTVSAPASVLVGAVGGMLLSGGDFTGLPVAAGSNLANDDIVPFLGLPPSRLPSPAAPALGDFTGAPSLNQSAAARTP